MTIVDPFAEPGMWLVTTASGASHLIDSTDPDAAVTITRATRAPAATAEGMRLADLRRDGDPLTLSSVKHATPFGRPKPGLRVGSEMLLVLEPLDPRADLTLRRTTPVATVIRLDTEEALTNE